MELKFPVLSEQPPTPGVDMEDIRRLDQRHAEGPAKRRNREIEPKEGTACSLRCAAATRSENDTNTL